MIAEQMLAQAQELIAKCGKPKALCALANLGDAWEPILLSMGRQDYALAKAVAKVYRLQQVLAKPGIDPERQAGRKAELQRVAGQVVVGAGIKEGLKFLQDLGVEVS